MAEIRYREGHNYSSEPFEGHTHRAKFSFFSGFNRRTGVKEYGSRDVYTDNPSKESVEELFIRKHKQKGSIFMNLKLEHFCTKERDDAVSRFIDDFLNED